MERYVCSSYTITKIIDIIQSDWQPCMLCRILAKNRVSLGVRTCELFRCFVAIVRVRAIVLTSLFSLFYVTGEFHRFLHRGRTEKKS